VPKINLILTLICREYFADKALHDGNLAWQPSGFDKEIDPQCRTPAVQARVARFSLYGGLISGILSAVIAPKLGALSDRFGRRRIMMITNAGALSGEILTIIAATFPETFPVYWILFGYFFDGICGSFIASMALSHSYATDCTPPNKRNVVFGYFHGCMFTGIALGPIVATYIIKWTGGVIVMFYIALGCHLFFILLLIFVIPESLPKRQQMAARERHRQMVEARGPSADWMTQVKLFNLFEPLKILYPKGPGTSPAVRRNLVLLAATDAIIFGVGSGAMTAVVLYSNYKFVWDAYKQSVFMSVVSSSRVICLLVVLPAITRVFRGKRHAKSNHLAPQTGTDLFELSIIRLAIFFDMMGFLGYTLAPNGDLFIASGAIASIGGIGSPTLQAALTKHVPPDRIGQLLGAMGLLHAFARVLAPTIFNEIYARTVGHYDQTVFVILTVLFGVAWIVSWLVRPGGKLNTRQLR
jgi:MFS family permease